jgi:hypothetical protein
MAWQVSRLDRVPPHVMEGALQRAGGVQDWRKNNPKRKSDPFTDAERDNHQTQRTLCPDRVSLPNQDGNGLHCTTPFEESCMPRHPLVSGQNDAMPCFLAGGRLGLGKSCEAVPLGNPQRSQELSAVAGPGPVCMSTTPSIFDRQPCHMTESFRHIEFNPTSSSPSLLHIGCGLQPCR